ncbi:hypothetical protein QQ045_004047 [Rhodiola kirilowii]
MRRCLGHRMVEGRGMSRTFRDVFFRTSNGAGTELKKAPAVENTLDYSLEELYKGAKKKMKISRTIEDAATRFLMGLLQST